MRYDAWK
jgi:hypothetical protein